MDMCALGIGLTTLVAFIIGLVLDVDTFAGGVFSILKGSKRKDK